MSTNQSFTENKVGKIGQTVRSSMSQLRFHISKNQSITACSVWCRYQTALRILKARNSQPVGNRLGKVIENCMYCKCI